MKCRYCGAEIPDDSAFCPNCGKEISNQRKCVKCGEIIGNNDSFCPYCGTEQPADEEVSGNGPSRKRLWLILAAVIAVIALAFGAYFFFSNDSKPGPTVAYNDTINVAGTDTSGKDTASIAKVSEQASNNEVDELTQRVKDIFSQAKIVESYGEDARMSAEENLDNTYLTSEFKSLLNNVAQVEENTGSLIIDIGHWSMSQDGSPIDYKVSDVNIEENGMALATVKYIYRDGQSATVRIVLKLERSNWFIDDFQCESAGVYSEKEMCYSGL